MPLDLESLRSHCLKIKGKISEEFPFDETTLVLKVEGRIFILVSTETLPLTINVKCDPERAIELREQYPAVTPGYHMNKKHWNTITIDGSIPSREILAMIDHSYELVKKKTAPGLRKRSATKTRH